ncbi:uncharacterized protein LOC125025518 [Penaeus chinensis]|uniref:uncharacterized protein LOC125025518 n=1 Tax=Penaeus chinensis TaxID=139456 RepID=UPI001FB6DCBE|nr:uncharacterized protein LOC125025518 [Penaeus chinensis]
MSGVLCDRKVPPRVKGKIRRTVVQPAMMYGMETVSLSIRDTKRLEVAEMKMCRWALGHTLKDHVRNEYIKERMGIVGIGVRCKESRLRWFGRVKRRDEVYVGRRGDGYEAARKEKAW